MPTTMRVSSLLARTGTRCLSARWVAFDERAVGASAMSDYVVIYEPVEDGAWGAHLPDLPGVVALGATRSEVGERIEEALAAYADDLRSRGRSLPAPHHTAGTVAA
jgi:predicted RNase H-like HicB family nuclease